MLFLLCVLDSIDKKELYLTIAIVNIALRNNLPANQVCGIKYFRNNISFILRRETVACNKSIKALTRKPMPIKRLNLSFNV